MLDNIVVSWHALLQWHYRASTYGDETEEHVKSALRASVKVTDRRTIPFPKLSHPHEFYYHPPSKAWLVVDERDPRERCIITVMMEQDEYLGLSRGGRKLFGWIMREMSEEGN